MDTNNYWSERMVTLRDVALKANVSKMTVSRVINHPEQVSDELKELVHHAMKELNYVPNYVARSLAQNITRVVKFLILEEIDVVEPYYMNLLTGISRMLDNHHYSLQLVTRKSINIGKCDGIIITGMRESDYSFIEGLDMPCVLFGENKHEIEFVDVDNELGAMLASNHLVEQGFEKIIFIGLDLDEPFIHLREKGYRDTMHEFEKEVSIFRMKNSSREAEEKIESIIGSEESLGIVCATDRIAIGVIRGLQKLGKEIPEQFGVTGFDGVFLDRISSPKITTVRQPVIEMGEACAKLLLDKIAGEEIEHVNRFTPTLMVRESTVI